MSFEGRSFGIVGALSAFPLRLAAREVERRGGTLRRGTGRGATDLVLGRRLLDARGDALTTRLAAIAGRRAISEGAFLRLLSGASRPTAGLTRTELLGGSGISAEDLDWLTRFDAFETDGAPYCFRDLILARKYAGLIAGGADWRAIVRSVHRFGPVASLTAKALHAEPCGAIYACGGDGLSELDGQLLLDLGGATDDIDALFEAAEAAEAAGDPRRAARLYGRCLEADPRDAVAAFNRANCLRAFGEGAAAVEHYLRAAKLDAGLVEAWFNLGCLMAERGRRDAARRHLSQAVALDPGYADAVYNLATLEFEAGNLAAARDWWLRYLALDSDSDWGRTAARGVRFAERELRGRAG